MSDEAPPETVDRRGLLGRGAALAAGTAAGALALGAVGSRPAAAAAGDPLVLGSGANRSARYTSLEYRPTDEPANRPTLGLVNQTGPALYLAPVPDDTDFVNGVGFRTEPGSFFTIAERPVYSGSDGSSGFDVGLATLDDVDLVDQPYLWGPYRILDTTKTFPGTVRDTASFDASGRLRGGRSIDLVVGGTDPSYTLSGVLLNVHSSGSAGNGYLAVHPPSVPAYSRNGPMRQSTLHFTKGQTVANFTVTAPDLLTTDDGPFFFVRIYASETTHVVVDRLGDIRNGLASDPNGGVPQPLPHRIRRPRSASRRITGKLRSPR